MAEAAEPNARIKPLLACYMANRSQLIRFSTARTGSSIDAENVLQIVYVRLCSRGEGCEETEIADPLAYLYRLCLSAASNYRRVRGRPSSQSDALNQLHARAENAEAYVNSPSREAHAKHRPRLEQMLTALKVLPPQQRRVFRLHYIQGLSNREISDVLGISSSAVENDMITALKRLATWQA